MNELMTHRDHLLITRLGTTVRLSNVNNTVSEKLICYDVYIQCEGKNLHDFFDVTVQHGHIEGNRKFLNKPNKQRLKVASPPR